MSEVCKTDCPIYGLVAGQIVCETLFSELYKQRVFDRIGRIRDGLEEADSLAEEIGQSAVEISDATARKNKATEDNLELRRELCPGPIIDRVEYGPIEGTQLVCRGFRQGSLKDFLAMQKALEKRQGLFGLD